MPRILSTAALFATAAALTAQVPYGSSIIGVIGNVAPGEGLYLADRAGNCSLVTGLLAAGSSNSNVNAVALDPIDDRIWIASTMTNQINWIRITGTTVTQFVQHATLPVVSPTAIVFDDDSNPITCAGTGTTGGVFRIDRRLGGPGTLIGNVPGTGIHNALAKDQAGNLYVGVYMTGQVHVMVKNVDGSYQPPVPFGTVPTVSITALAFAPAVGSSPAELWITTFGVAGNQMYRMPVPAGGAAVPVVNGLGGCNWIDYDRSQNDFLVSPQAGPSRLMQVNRSNGVATQLCVLQGGMAGVPACNDVNDAPFASMAIAPMILNGSVGPFDLELGTTAPPGTLALFGIGAPFVSVVGANVVGADGHLNFRFPNVTLPSAIGPGTVTFVAAYFDTTANLIVGVPVPWPAL